MLSGSIIEQVDADKITIKQSFVSGELEFWITPGLNWQNFGKITTYPKSGQYWFSGKKDQGGNNKDESVETRFNDGARAWISGGVRYEMPLTNEKLTSIHTTFGGADQLVHTLIRTSLERAVFYAGMLVSSRQSYGDGRAQLAWFIEDQLKHGVYRTESYSSKVTDELTKEIKEVTLHRLMQNPNSPGGYERIEESALAKFGVNTFNLSINDIRYDDAVTKQIGDQQKITMDVQTSIANKLKAEQDRITAEEQGKANAMTAKWTKETEKIQKVVEAQQKKEVAELEAQQKYNVTVKNAEANLQQATIEAKVADQYKYATLTKAEADSTARKKMMEADGALDKKLEALVAMNKANADAIANIKQPLVPSTVIGGGNGDGKGSSFSVQDMLGMMMLNNAKAIGLDMGIKPKVQQ